MSANDQVASAGGGAPLRRFRVRPPRPTGIRNGGLLLVLVALAGPGERPRSLDRAHPNRQHPRPARSQISGQRSGDAAARPVGGGQGGTGISRPPVGQPPVTTPPVEPAPAARVPVPSVTVRVRPPALLGRDLPEVRAETPQVTVETSAAEVPRLRLG